MMYDCLQGFVALEDVRSKTTLQVFALLWDFGFGV